MNKSRLIDFVVFGLLILVTGWTYFDWLAQIRAAEWYAEKPIRLAYVFGLAVGIAICLAFLLGEPRHRNGHEHRH